MREVWGPSGSGLEGVCVYREVLGHGETIAGTSVPYSRGEHEEVQEEPDRSIRKMPVGDP